MEEVKLAIKPFYQKREVTKDEYKDILRKAVQKVRGWHRLQRVGEVFSPGPRSQGSTAPHGPRKSGAGGQDSRPFTRHIGQIRGE